MSAVLTLPTALAEPVRQTRIRGRLPRSVVSLSRARLDRRVLDDQQAERRANCLRDEVAQVIKSREFDHTDLQLLGRALSILEGRLRDSGAPLESPFAVRCFLTLRLGGLPHEEFGVMFLDSQNRLIAFESLFRGTLCETSVYPREVLLKALAHGARSVILAHNHPSGEASPSTADVRLTQSLKAALGLVDVRVLDHFIVTAQTSASMAEMGLV